MKYRIPFAIAALAAGCGAAQAAELGQVVSSTPVLMQVAVPQQQCSEQQAQLQQPPSGAGALIGALVGGAVGSNLGSGFGRAAATGLGVVAGSVIGNNVEAANTPPVATTLRNCRTVTGYENRVVGYDVSYDYNGQRYTSRLAQAPAGDKIELNVGVAMSNGATVVTPLALAAPVQPVATQQAVAYAPATVVAPYGYYPYGGPVVSVVPRIVIGGGYWRRW